MQIESVRREDGHFALHSKGEDSNFVEEDLLPAVG